MPYKSGLNKIAMPQPWQAIVQRFCSILFLMNHNKESERVTLNEDYRDLLNGRAYQTGNSIEIEGREVFVLENQRRER